MKDIGVINNEIGRETVFKKTAGDMLRDKENLFKKKERKYRDENKQGRADMNKKAKEYIEKYQNLQHLQMNLYIYVYIYIYNKISQTQSVYKMISKRIINSKNICI